MFLLKVLELKKVPIGVLQTVHKIQKVLMVNLKKYLK